MSIMPGPEPDSLFAVVKQPEPVMAIVPSAATQPTYAIVEDLDPNFTVSEIDFSRIKSHLIKVALLLMAGHRIDCHYVERRTGSLTRRAATGTARRAL